MAYSHILAAVTASDEAVDVLAKANEMAQQHHAKLSVVTVVKPLVYSYGSMAPNMIAPMSVQFDKEALDYTQTELARLCEGLDVDAANQHVLMGRPSSEIKALAERLETQLIVIGTHGRHGLGLLLGSTANGVVHGTPCDVLAVRVHDEETQ